MSAVGRYLLLALGLFVWGATPSRAEDLERGKSGPAIFAADCSACHRSAQGLAYGMSPSALMDLLRQHYTTGPAPANQLAAYLLSVVGNFSSSKIARMLDLQEAAVRQRLARARKQFRQLYALENGEHITNNGTPATTTGIMQRSKRRARGEEAAEPAGQRPPGEIKSNETAIGEQGEAASDHGRPGPASKRRQRAEHPAEPALPSGSKKFGLPTAATHGPESELARPPESIPVQPSDPGATRPIEPADARQPGPSGETKTPEITSRPERAKAEAAPETEPVRAAAPVEVRRPTPRPHPGDQPAFSAPSP